MVNSQLNDLIFLQTFNNFSKLLKLSESGVPPPI